MRCSQSVSQRPPQAQSRRKNRSGQNSGFQGFGFGAFRVQGREDLALDTLYGEPVLLGYLQLRVLHHWLAKSHGPQVPRVGTIRNGFYIPPPPQHPSIIIVLQYTPKPYADDQGPYIVEALSMVFIGTLYIKLPYCNVQARFLAESCAP